MDQSQALHFPLKKTHIMPHYTPSFRLVSDLTNKELQECIQLLNTKYLCAKCLGVVVGFTANKKKPPSRFCHDPKTANSEMINMQQTV